MEEMKLGINFQDNSNQNELSNINQEERAKIINVKKLHELTELKEIPEIIDESDSINTMSQERDQNEKLPKEVKKNNQCENVSKKESETDLFNPSEKNFIKDELNKALIFVPTTFCMISKFPFFKEFKKLLLSLCNLINHSSSYPLEYLVAYLVTEVPAPPRGFYKIQIGLEEKNPLIFYQPPSNELPLLDINFEDLINSLSAENIIEIVNLILLEKQVN